MAPITGRAYQRERGVLRFDRLTVSVSLPTDPTNPNVVELFDASLFDGGWQHRSALAYLARMKRYNLGHGYYQPTCSSRLR